MTAVFHVGTIVDDLNAAIAMYTGLGFGPWVRDEAWMCSPCLDVPAARIAMPRTRVAFGRLNETMAIELIQPDPDSDLPAVFRRDSGLAHAHLGLWSEHPDDDAAQLVDGGARFVWCRGAELTDADARAAAASPGWRPRRVDTSYLLTDAQLLVEVVPTAVWYDRLIKRWGAGIAAAIPPPPDHRDHEFRGGTR